MEVSLYDNLHGAMMPQGEWWSYDSPLLGERVPSRQQGVHLNCCASSGPRGLLRFIREVWVWNNCHVGVGPKGYQPARFMAAESWMWTSVR
jgi:DUF1680 family protein